jgi:hypothetical protein
MIKMNVLNSMDRTVNATELVELLNRLIAENGDLEISIGMTAGYEPVVRFGDIDVLE